WRWSTRGEEVVGSPRRTPGRDRAEGVEGDARPEARLGPLAAGIGDSGPYSGEVAPGGPPDTRELAQLIVTKLAVDKEMSNNAYLLRCRATDEQVLIDAAAEPDALRQLVGASGLTKVITTHQHW